eukprot:2428788-Prymnesium_polylepis.5
MQTARSGNPDRIRLMVAIAARAPEAQVDAVDCRVVQMGMEVWLAVPVEWVTAGRLVARVVTEVASSEMRAHTGHIPEWTLAQRHNDTHRPNQSNRRRSAVPIQFERRMCRSRCWRRCSTLRRYKMQNGSRMASVAAWVPVGTPEEWVVLCGKGHKSVLNPGSRQIGKLLLGTCGAPAPTTEFGYRRCHKCGEGTAGGVEGGGRIGGGAGGGISAIDTVTPGTRSSIVNV